MIRINDATAFIKFILTPLLHEGDTAIDATAGNGMDTVFLSRAVGESGRIYAFDIQEEAVKAVEARLQNDNCFKNVTVIHDGHENIQSYVKENISAAMFNLGYLPGGNNQIITKADTTLLALNQCLRLLKKGGIISLCFYIGHEGGLLEYETIYNYVRKLDSKSYDVLRFELSNKAESSPIIILVQKNL